MASMEAILKALTYQQQLLVQKAEDRQKLLNQILEQMKKFEQGKGKTLETEHLDVDSEGSSSNSRGSGNSNCPNSFHMNPKVEFPLFDGSNPRGWIKKCTRYFSLCKIPEKQRVDLASMYLIGRAETWFGSYALARRNIIWEDFILDICTRFEGMDRTNSVAMTFMTENEVGKVKKSDSFSKNELKLNAHQVFDKMSERAAVENTAPEKGPLDLPLLSSDPQTGEKVMFTHPSLSPCSKVVVEGVLASEGDHLFHFKIAPEFNQNVGVVAGLFEEQECKFMTENEIGDVKKSNSFIENKPKFNVHQVFDELLEGITSMELDERHENAEDNIYPVDLPTPKQLGKPIVEMSAHLGLSPRSKLVTEVVRGLRKEKSNEPDDLLVFKNKGSCSLSKHGAGITKNSKKMDEEQQELNATQVFDEIAVRAIILMLDEKHESVVENPIFDQIMAFKQLGVSSFPNRLFDEMLMEIGHNLFDEITSPKGEVGWPSFCLDLVAYMVYVAFDPGGLRQYSCHWSFAATNVIYKLKVSIIVFDPGGKYGDVGSH